MKSEWIPLKEKFPEEKTLVLVYLQKNYISYFELGFYTGENPFDWDSWYFTNDRANGDEVTHWMPLPEPPQ